MSSRESLITIHDLGVRYDNTNTSAENPAVLTSQNLSTVVLTVTGNNFDKLDGKQYVYYDPSSFSELKLSSSWWNIDTEKGIATLRYVEQLTCNTSVFEFMYASEWGVEVNSGVYIIYQE